MKGPVGRPIFKWEDNIKTDLIYTGCENADWINLLLRIWINGGFF